MSITENLKVLGLKARDKLTGFEGTITSISFDLSGDIGWLLCPVVQPDGKMSDQVWFKPARLDLLDVPRALPVPKFET